MNELQGYSVTVRHLATGVTWHLPDVSGESTQDAARQAECFPREAWQLGLPVLSVWLLWDDGSDTEVRAFGRVTDALEAGSALQQERDPGDWEWVRVKDGWWVLASLEEPPAVTSLVVTRCEVESPAARPEPEI